MNLPSPELVLSNTNATIVRHKLPSTTYGSKDAIIQIVRDAVDLGDTIRNVYAFALDGSKRDCRDAYLCFLVEYENDHFDLFDDSQLNMGNPARELEVLSMMQHFSLLGKPNHLFYSTTRLPNELKTMPPLQAACAVKTQKFKPLLPNWHAFTGTFNKELQLLSKSIYREDEWSSLHDDAMSAIREIQVCPLNSLTTSAKDTSKLCVGTLRGMEHTVFALVDNTRCQICFVPLTEAFVMFQAINGECPVFVFEDFLPESVRTSHGQRVLTLNKISKVAATEENLKWVFRELRK